MKIALCFFSLIFLVGCDSYYLAFIENDSDVEIKFVGRNNPEGGIVVGPMSSKTIGWDELCQSVIVDGKLLHLNSSAAPSNSFVQGRTTPGTFKILFDKDKFYFKVSSKNKVKIELLDECSKNK